MQNSRLIEILKSFDKSELKLFEKFLDSSFVKSRRVIKPVLKYISGFHPDFASSDLDKKRVSEKLFPGEAYSEKKIINLMGDLTKECENFLKHKTLDDDEITSMLLTSKEFFKKKLFRHSFRIAEGISKKITSGFSPGKDYFSKLRQLLFLKSSYYITVNDYGKMIDCKKDFFEASAAQFIIDLIQIRSSMDPALITYGKKIENDFIKALTESFDIDLFFEKLEKSNYAHKSLIDIHYFLFKTLEIPEEKKYYFLLRDLFYGNTKNFDREEKYFLFNHLANYCSNEVSKRNEEFYFEALDVYKQMLKNEAYSFSESEYMQTVTYRNIIYYCNTVKDDKWFEHFIDKYSGVIAPRHREEMKNFALANLYFLRKEFENSLMSISRITYEFFLFKPDLKNLMLKVYYELEYFEQAYSLIDTYKHYLSGTKEISESYKVFYRNFVNRYLELIKIKTGTGRRQTGYLKSKIVKENKIVNKIWLLEKVEELILKNNSQKKD
ncbi:MAG: hypothetical protein HGGPFJEG_00029 [Ignavibacteria bacterium]|nr:hypothetical protein [Ignavibacteria bacterium]